MRQPSNLERYTHPLGALCLLLVCQTAVALTTSSLELASLLFTALILIWAKLYEGRSWRSLGWYDPKAALHLLIGFAQGLAICLVSVGLAWACGALSFKPDLTVQQGLWRAVVLLLLVSLSEELVLRGWLLPNLTRQLGIWPGCLLAGLVFGFLHANNPYLTGLGFLNLGLFGVVASLYLLHDASLYRVIGLHSSWNLAQALLVGLPISGLDYQQSGLFQLNQAASHWLNGGPFGLEASIPFSCALSALFVKVYWHFKPKQEPSYTRK